jgi:predicted phage terminase large subunit-like protein
MDVAAGKISRLLITMPPRHGKSEFASKWLPSWYLGNFPDNRVILASYGASFAASWGRKTRDILNEHGPRLFGVSIRSDSKAADEWLIEGREGGMQTCGVGGPLTGKGADLLIIDDPVKNAEEANSEVYRQKTWEWYTSTAYTRLEPGGALVLIQTRWHEDDLAGRILANAAESGEPWVVLNLPAIAGEGDQLGRSPGEPLWPERFGLDDFDRIRKAVGSYQFSALYGQSPTPADGGLFKRAWFRYWTPAGNGHYRLGAGGGLVSVDHCRRFGTMDLAFSLKKTADFTVICAWAVTPRSDLILLDMARSRMEAPSLVPTAKDLSDRWDLDYLGIEKILGQALVVKEAQDKGMTVRQLIPDVDKITRSIPAQIRMENGQVYLPQGHPDLDVIEKELLTFPRGTHDDIVDNFSYAAADIKRFGGAEEPAEVREAREEGEKTVDRARRQELDRLAHEDPFHPRWFDGGTDG